MLGNVVSNMYTSCHSKFWCSCAWTLAPDFGEFFFVCVVFRLHRWYFQYLLGGFPCFRQLCHFPVQFLTWLRKMCLQKMFLHPRTRGVIRPLSLPCWCLSSVIFRILSVYYAIRARLSITIARGRALQALRCLPNAPALTLLCGICWP